MLRHLETDQCSRTECSTTALLEIALHPKNAKIRCQLDGEYQGFRKLICPGCRIFEFDVVSTLVSHIEKSDCFFSQFDKEQNGIWQLLREIRHKTKRPRRLIYSCKI
jgi:hypothetical protein